jgi:hypothetical protein
VHDLAWLSSDRAIMISQKAGDDLLAGLAVTRVANALSSLGRIRPALEISVSMANQVAPGENHEATKDPLSVYGILLLQGAMAAARLGLLAVLQDFRLAQHSYRPR